jgi:hypothetical protein
MRLVFIALICLFSLQAKAAGKITSFEVSGDLLEFTTSKTKSGTRPVCVDASKEQLWAVALNSSGGKAIYALIITASSMAMPVKIVSADDCADKAGVERALRLQLVPTT